MVVRTSGSIGALLLSFAIYRYFKASGKTSALLTMMGQIMYDMLPFMLIFALGVYGFGFFFLIHDPTAFGYDQTTVGIVWPFVSMYLLSLGAYDAADYPDPLSLLVLLLALLFSTVLLLNLLIGDVI